MDFGGLLIFAPIRSSPSLETWSTPPAGGAVHLRWLYRFIKLAKLKPKFMPFIIKIEENGIKTIKMGAQPE